MKDSYFYSGWSSEIYPMPKIREEFLDKTKEWEVVEPVRSVIKPATYQGIRKKVRSNIN